MIRFYVSCRPIYLPIEPSFWLTPRHLLEKSFNGMPLQFTTVAWNSDIDGRMLYQIDVDTVEHRDVVVEALAWFGCHQKTLGSAKELAELLTGQTYDLIGDPAAEYCGEDEGLIAPVLAPAVPA